ncbi:MAG: PHP domain-containing protein [Treponema sp.]|nr:PHP domain-containing protein [Treponema sp.]
MKADLHLHSAWSDGSLGIPRLVRFAKALGLDAVSVTDHDTMAGQEEALAEGKKQGLAVIPGVEISAFNPETGRKAHILGYQVRDMEGLTQACRPWLRARHEKNMESLDLIIQAGYPLCREDVLEYAALDGTLYRQHIMHALADRAYTSAVYGPLYTRLFGPGGLAAVTARYMDAEEAVRLIRDCGGLAVLAHPFQYDTMGFLPRLAALGLAGIEHRHPTQNPERQRAVEEAARHYGLFLSGGSDFHGFYSGRPVPPGAMDAELPAELAI